MAKVTPTDDDVRPTPTIVKVSDIFIPCVVGSGSRDDLTSRRVDDGSRDLKIKKPATGWQCEGKAMSALWPKGPR